MSDTRWPSGLRWLAVFWGVVLLAVAGGGVTLAVLGPVRRPAPVEVAIAKPAPAPVAAKPAAEAPPPAPVTLRPPGTRIPAPDPALQEVSAEFAPNTLPRIGPDGRTPLEAYAGGVNPYDARPRVAILLAGIGLSTLDSEAAVSQLPAAVSLAVTPYATRSEKLLDLARAAGHELFVSLALEPSRYPLDDPGPQTLLTSLSPAINAGRLQWTLSRFPGTVGAVGALGGMRGERFAQSDQMFAVLQDLAARGLGYVDPRPGIKLVRPQGAPWPALRNVDLVIDEPAVRVEIEAKLARLEQIARDRGNATGFAGGPAPVTLDRLAAWSATLSQRGLLLVPVTSLFGAR